MDDGLDYEVHTKIQFRLDFNSEGEFNTLLLPDIQKAFVNHVKELYEQDDVLGSYIPDDLNFHFDGRRVDLEYTFSCHDENAAEAESFSEYSVRQIQEELERFGCKLIRVTCSAEEADMTWLDQLEDAVFGPRETGQRSGSAADDLPRQKEPAVSAQPPPQNERVENFVYGHMRNAASPLVKKLQPCPTLACIAGNIPPEKSIHWKLSEECYHIRFEEIQLCLHSLIGHSASLAAHGCEEQLPVLQDFVCALAAYWPENPGEGDPWETEKQYGRMFDDAVAHARASGDAPELSKEQKEAILVGLENYLIDFVSQFSVIDQEALESGLGACESVAAGLQQTWGTMQQTECQEPLKNQLSLSGITM